MRLRKENPQFIRRTAVRLDEIIGLKIQSLLDFLRRLTLVKKNLSDLAP